MEPTKRLATIAQSQHVRGLIALSEPPPPEARAGNGKSGDGSGGDGSVRVTVCLSAEAARMADLVPGGDGAPTASAPGSDPLTLTFRVTNIPAVKPLLLSLGTDVTVLEPAALRAELNDVFVEMALRYMNLSLRD